MQVVADEWVGGYGDCFSGSVSKEMGEVSFCGYLGVPFVGWGKDGGESLPEDSMTSVGGEGKYSAPSS